MSTDKEPQHERAPGLVKSEVICQEPIFFFTFLSAIISTSALSLNYFYYGCKITEAHLSFTYKFNNAQWGEKRPSLLTYLFKNAETFPQKPHRPSPLHITCLNYMMCPCLNQLLPRELEPAYPEARRTKGTCTKSSL